MDGTEAQQILAAFDRIADRLERANSVSRSSISVHAGGAAIWIVAWIAGLCCAFMAGTVFVGGFWVLDQSSRAAAERAELRKRDNDFQDYISAIYQAAPDLQKRIEAEKAEESK